MAGKKGPVTWKKVYLEFVVIHGREELERAHRAATTDAERAAICDRVLASITWPTHPRKGVRTVDVSNPPSEVYFEIHTTVTDPDDF